MGCHSHGKGAFAILRVGNSVHEHHVGLQANFLVVTYFLLSGYYMLFIYDEAFHPPTIIRYHCYILCLAIWECVSLQQKGRNTHFIENHVISRIFINHLYGIHLYGTNKFN